MKLWLLGSVLFNNSSSKSTVVEWWDDLIDGMESMRKKAT
jgi:hypothetical protein